MTSNPPAADPSSPSPIEHDEAAGRFRMPLPDGGEAVLDYARRGGTLDFHHTFVPPSHRGQGLADRIVRAGFVWARHQGLKVVPSCFYVATWLRRHPEEQDLVDRHTGRP